MADGRRQKCTTAFRLLRQSEALGLQLELSLYEGETQLGGVIQTETHDSLMLELGPDCFLSESLREENWSKSWASNRN